MKRNPRRACDAEGREIAPMPNAGDRMDTPIRLSPSEKQTLKDLAAREHDPFASDWVALQRLKGLGLAEEESTRRVKITTKGVRVLQELELR